MNLSLGYNFGLLAAVLIGALVGLGIIALLFKLKVMDLTFDERQELARGKAFQYGFFTLIIAVYAYGISDMMFGRWCDVLTGVTICLTVGLCVFAITCILKDAYLSLREKPRTVMTMFVLISAVNLGFGGMYAVSGDLLENGVLTFRAVNPILGLATLVILIVYIVNHLLRSREEEAE